MSQTYFADPKVLAVGFAAEAVFVRMIALSTQLNTDGYVARTQLALAGCARCTQHVRKLHEAGLIIATQEGWQIVNFLKWNPSKEQREAEKAKTRERARRFREKHNNALLTPPDTDTDTDTDTTPLNPPSLSVVNKDPF